MKLQWLRKIGETLSSGGYNLIPKSTPVRHTAPEGGYPGLELTTTQGDIIGVGRRYGHLVMTITQPGDNHDLYARVELYAPDIEAVREMLEQEPIIG